MFFTVETQQHNFEIIERLRKFIENELELDYERTTIFIDNESNNEHMLTVYEVTQEELELLSNYESYIMDY